VIRWAAYVLHIARSKAGMPLENLQAGVNIDPALNSAIIDWISSSEVPGMRSLLYMAVRILTNVPKLYEIKNRCENTK